MLELDRSLEDTLPYLFALLGIEEQPSPLQQMDAQIRRRRTFEALKKLFLRESLNQPLILIFEDLHWIDSETQGFLDTLSEGVAQRQVLLLVKLPPGVSPRVGAEDVLHATAASRRLARAEAEEFLDLSCWGRRRAHVCTSPTRHSFSRRPKARRSSWKRWCRVGRKASRSETAGISARRSAYRRRYTSLPPCKACWPPASIASRPTRKPCCSSSPSLAGSFPLSLVRQVITQPEAELYRLLASLQRKEFLYEQPAFPEVEYIFKHALTQEVAYGTVLQEQRKLLHERTGQALEALYTATLLSTTVTSPITTVAVPTPRKPSNICSWRDSRRCNARLNTEAISHLSAALDLLLTRPETPERAAQELTLRLAVGPPLMVAQGWTAPEVEQHYARARALCAQLGDVSQRFPVLWGLWMFHMVRGDMRTAQALAEECLQLAEQTNEAGLLLEAHFAIGATFLFRGEFVRARVAMEQSMALYQPQHQALTPLYGGFNPQVVKSRLYGLGAVGSGVSRAGPDADARGAAPGAGARPPLESRDCLILGRLVA